MVSTVQVAHTAELDSDTLRAARALLDDVFAPEMTDADWDHALGGIHALVWEDGELLAHASVVQRQLLHAGHTLRTGYVEGVAVRADCRRRGHGAAVMEGAERVVRRAYQLGALGSTDEAAAFYAARGWKRWRGRSWALTPGGVVRTPDEDGDIYILEVDTEIDVSGDLTCDWRAGDLW
jgi:aminoglycoside 2'-N-acetyltransferase I